MELMFTKSIKLVPNLGCQKVHSGNSATPNLWLYLSCSDIADCDDSKENASYFVSEIFSIVLLCLCTYSASQTTLNQTPFSFN
jgi:hypothetical protein